MKGLNEKTGRIIEFNKNILEVDIDSTSKEKYQNGGIIK